MNPTSSALSPQQLEKYQTDGFILEEILFSPEEVEHYREVLASPENGFLRMVKGSHRLGALNHIEPDGGFRGACQESHLWEDDSKIEDLACKAGAVSIHHCLTLHGSPPNLSGRPRRAIIFSYRTDDAYQIADNVFKDTGLLVSGQRRGKVRFEAGVAILPRRVQNDWSTDPYGSAWNQVGELARENPELIRPS